MKNSILLFLFLIPIFLFAQYPTGTNKSRLGYQTTGDGLIWRGVAADTVTKPRTTANAYFQLDTVAGVLRRYIATRGKWQVVAGGGGSTIDSLVYSTIKGLNDSIQAEKQTLTFANPLLGISDGNNVDLSGLLGGYVTGSGTINRVPKWSATSNLTDSNIQDNGTAVSILNSKPLEPGKWTTPGRPSGVTGYMGFNTTLGYQEFYDGSTWFPTGFWGKTGTYLHYSAGDVAIGFSSTPSYPVHQRKAGGVGYIASENTSTTGYAGFRSINSIGGVTDLFKYGTGLGTYKNLAGGDGGIYNNTGNFGFLNDNASGTINFAAGASSTAQLTINTNGNILIGTTTDIGVRLTVASTATGIVPLFDGSANPGTGVGSVPQFFLRNTNATNNKVEFKFGGTTAARQWSFGTDINGTGENSFFVYANATNRTNIFSTSGGNTLIGFNGVPVVADAIYTLGVSGTNALGLPRGTVAQRPTIASSTTPFRYSTDSIALEYGESVGTWRQLATRAYARSMKDGNGIYSGSGTVPTGTVAYMSPTSTLRIGSFTGSVFSPLSGARVNAKGYYNVASFNEQGMVLLDSTSFKQASVRIRPYVVTSNFTNGASKYTYATDVGETQVNFRATMVGAVPRNHYTLMDSTKFSIVEGLTAFTSDTLFKINFGGANSGTLRAYKYGTGAKKASSLGLNKATHLAGFVRSGTDVGTIVDYPLDSIPTNSIYNNLPIENVTIDANGNGLEINDLGEVYFETSDGNNYIALAETEAEIGSTGTVGLIAGQNSSRHQASLYVQGEFGDESRVDYRVETRFGYHRVELDSTEFSISEAKTGSAQDTLFKVEFENDGRTTLKGKLRALREDYNNITSTTSPVTLSSTIPDNLINQGSTQASFTLKMPPSPVDGQVCMITYGNTITTLTLDGNGTTILGTVTTTGQQGSRRMYKYYSPLSAWVRVD